MPKIPNQSLKLDSKKKKSSKELILCQNIDNIYKAPKYAILSVLLKSKCIPNPLHTVKMTQELQPLIYQPTIGSFNLLLVIFFYVFTFYYYFSRTLQTQFSWGEVNIIYLSCTIFLLISTSISRKLDADENV